MKVRDILMKAAVSIGREDLADAINTSGNSVSGEIEEFLFFFNETENELCSCFYERKAESEFTTTDGKILISKFTLKPNRIEEIRDESGKRVPYEIYSNYIKTVEGTVKVKYIEEIVGKAINGDTENIVGANEYVYVAGIVKYYYLSKSMYNECAIWNRIFRDYINNNLLRRTRNGRVPERRWD